MANISYLQRRIEQLWAEHAQLTLSSSDAALEVIEEAMSLMDSGSVRVCEQANEKWQVNTWLKQAILLFFKLKSSVTISYGGAEQGPKGGYYDKIPLKFSNWEAEDFSKVGIRVVPGAVVRYSAYIASNVILMPSFVNVGAYIGEGTLIDAWATVGSCAQVGRNCHISGGAGIGGVLEPIQANPVIIEDDVFIGARSEVVEGVIVEKGAVLSMGVYIGASTRVYDRTTGEIHYGRIPAYSVVVPGTLPSSDGKTSTYAAIIVKTVDANTRAKTALNELLRLT